MSEDDPSEPPGAEDQRPRSIGSRLFASVDMAGSTEWKQAAIGGPGRPGSVWITEFLAFYQQFPAYFATAAAQVVGQLPRSHGFASTGRLTFWKAIGDELIFQAPVTHEDQILVNVLAWQAAMERMRAVFQGKTMRLDVKGFAWVATFPHPDRELAIPLDGFHRHAAEAGGRPAADHDPAAADAEHGTGRRDTDYAEWTNQDLLRTKREDTDYRLDFLGPTMDTGFRLGKHARPDRFVMAIEVAYALAQALNGLEEFAAPKIVFCGEVELAGVWQGHPYPLFALEGSGGFEQYRRIKLLAPEARSVTASETTNAIGPLLEGNWPAQVFLPDSGHVLRLNREDLRRQLHEVARRLDEDLDAPENARNVVRPDEGEDVEASEVADLIDDGLPADGPASFDGPPASDDGGTIDLTVTDAVVDLRADAMVEPIDRRRGWWWARRRRRG